MTALSSVNGRIQIVPDRVENSFTRKHVFAIIVHVGVGKLVRERL